MVKAVTDRIFPVSFMDHRGGGTGAEVQFSTSSSGSRVRNNKDLSRLVFPTPAVQSAPYEQMRLYAEKDQIFGFLKYLLLFLISKADRVAVM